MQKKTVVPLSTALLSLIMVTHSVALARGASLAFPAIEVHPTQASQATLSRLEAQEIGLGTIDALANYYVYQSLQGQDPRQGLLQHYLRGEAVPIPRFDGSQGLLAFSEVHKLIEQDPTLEGVFQPHAFPTKSHQSFSIGVLGVPVYLFHPAVSLARVP